MRIFLSYTPANRPVAGMLAKSLQVNGIDIEDPHAEAFPGDNVFLDVGRALERCRAMVVLISSDFSDSEFCQFEVNRALASGRYAHRVFPVFLDRTRRVVPWYLRKLPSPHFDGDVSRLASDIETLVSTR